MTVFSTEESSARVLTVTRDAHQSIRELVDCFENSSDHDEIIIDTTTLVPDMTGLGAVHAALGTTEDELPLYNTGYLVLVC